VPLDQLPLPDRIALAVTTRLEVIARGREAVRRALTLLSLPQHMPLALRLSYHTADDIWWAAGDRATDFSFYTKRLTLAGIHTATVLYWLEDTSPDFADTRGFLGRRLAAVARLGRARRQFQTAIQHLPNPIRLLRQFR
jgi:ubiquinone biosynthesis protein COQ9